MKANSLNLKKHRTWCELSESALKNNISEVLQFIPNNLRKMAIVKADGYGHDGVWISKIALENGFSDLAVACLEEGIALRKANINVPILILSPFQPETAEYLIQYDLSQTISSEYEANTLLSELEILEKNEFFDDHSNRVKVHFKLNTGMNRIGFSVYGMDTQNNLKQIANYTENNKIEPIGIFTHFAAADEPEKDFTTLQLNRFEMAIKELENLGITFPMKHCANSAATIMFPDSFFDAVRVGIFLYGCCPNNKIKEKMHLEPVMSMFSRVSSIHETNEDTTVGYGLTYSCQRYTRIATIEAGYADGINRHLSNKGFVLIHGQKAPIIGNICMDRLMLDITDLKNVHIGDEVLIFGKDKANYYLDLDEMAKLAGTISYEILCGITDRVPKIYF